MYSPGLLFPFPCGAFTSLMLQFVPLLCSFLDSFMLQTLSVLLPFRLSSEDFALVWASQEAASVVGNLAGPVVVSCIGSTRFVWLCLAMNVAAAGLTGLAHSAAAMASVRFGAGLFSLRLSAFLFVYEYFLGHEILLFQRMFILAPLGGISGAIGGAVLYDRLGWTLAFSFISMTFAALVMGVGIVTCGTADEPCGVASRGTEASGSVTTGGSAFSRTFLMIGCVSFVYGWQEAMSSVLLATWFKPRFGLNEIRSAMIVVCNMGALLLSQASGLMWYISTRAGCEASIAVGLLSMATLYAVFSVPSCNNSVACSLCSTWLIMLSGTCIVAPNMVRIRQMTSSLPRVAFLTGIARIIVSVGSTACPIVVVSLQAMCGISLPLLVTVALCVSTVALHHIPTLRHASPYLF